MAYENITKRYDNLFKAQDNGLQQKRNSAINGFNSTMANTKTKYANIYKGLDQQNATAKSENYSERNDIDTGVSQNLNRVSEIMARNGWGQGGGENLQAQLNSNSDRQNGFGGADKSMNDKYTNILNARNTNMGDAQNTYNDLNTQINSARTNYNADSTALRANLDAGAQQDIYQAMEAQKQRDFQAAESAKARAAAAAQAAASRRSSYGGGGGGGNGSNPQPTTGTNSGVKLIDSIVNGTYKASGGNLSEKGRQLQALIASYKNQNGINAEWLRGYAEDAVQTVNSQMVQHVNIDRYSGYGDYLDNQAKQKKARESAQASRQSRW